MRFLDGVKSDQVWHLARGGIACHNAYRLCLWPEINSLCPAPSPPGEAPPICYRCRPHAQCPSLAWTWQGRELRPPRASWSQAALFVTVRCSQIPPCWYHGWPLHAPKIPPLCFPTIPHSAMQGKLSRKPWAHNS